MQYRKFGNTEYKVSEIGFGTWPLAGGQNGAIAYGSVNEIESIQALRYAYDNGINFYDTADFYGYGYVEKLLGDSLADVRKNVIFATKVGLVSDDGYLDFSTDHMVEAIELSLKRLKTDYIDIYLLHCPKLEMLNDGRIQSLLQIFQLEGKIREYGISVKTPSEAIIAIEKFSFDIVEINYNVLDHRAKNLGVFDLCREKNVATIIRTPLGQGLISGEFEYNSDSSDIRNSMSKEVFDKNVDAYNEMIKRINDSSRTRTQIALQFCLNEPVSSCVIPGMKTVNHVKENIMSINHDAQLSQSDLDIIYQVYDKYKL